MEKLKGVCVGLGYFSQFHLEAWERIENVEITAVCDTQIQKAKLAAIKYGIESFYSNVEKMILLEKPDFIDIITPPETHYELCLLAIQHGVQIICQKPLAPTLSEAKLIAKAVQNSNIRMMVHENFRFQPWHREIKSLLSKNAIGNRLHAIHWRMRMGDGWQDDAYMNRQPYFREMKQLLMYETGVHLLDVLRCFGGEINQVYAKLKRLNSNIKGEDFAWVMCDFEKGGSAFIDANRYNESICNNPRLTFGSVLVEGNEGSIRLYEDGKLTVQPLGKKETQHHYDYKDRNFSGDCVYFTQKHFIEHLLSRKPFETDVNDYLKNIVLLEKIYESAETKLPVIQK